MNDRLNTLAILGLLATSACAGSSVEGKTTGVDQGTATPVEPAAAESVATSEEPTRAPIAIAQSLHADSMTEVVLEPRGSAALTLDDEGGVRLWPEVMGEDVREPLELPVREPVWMSLARRSDSSFVAAFIDTSGGAQVGRIDTSDDGATWTPLLDHPPTRPMFELHVLDGGKRILALSVDHQIELWTPKGKVVAEVDEPGFVPWQLRVSQPAQGEPEILAVLGRPVRVQKVALHDDALKIEGEARPVDMDRGPNRNDLAMSPDGKQVTVLRRPKARGKRFEVEITDLETGQRRLLAAESDLGKRPRVYPMAEDRLLVESGSGAGFYLDLTQAVAWPPEDADPNVELDASVVAPTSMTAVTLAGSSLDARFHADLAAGVRAVPDGKNLIVAPLDDRPALTHRTSHFGATALALDETGERVAWGTPGELVVEDRRSGELGRIAAPGSSANLVAFVGSQRLVSMDPKGNVTLRTLEGEVLGTDKIDFSWGISASGWRRGESAGSIVLSSIKPKEAVRVLDVGHDGFGERREIPRAERTQWPEAGKPRGGESSDWVQALGLSMETMGLRPASVRLSEPDPTGERIAIVQKTEHISGFDERVGSWVEGPHQFVITMVDRKSGKRVWTRQAHGIHDLAWSADGEVFGYIDSEGGYLCDADDGDLQHTRHDLGLVTDRG